MPLDDQRHRHGRCGVHGRGPRADHRRADLGQLQGRRRRRRRARCSSRSIGGRSKRRCSRPQANLAARHRAGGQRARRRPQRYQDLAAARHRHARAGRSRRTTSAAALEATVAADRAAVENAKVQLQYATIAAPIAGRTGALMVHAGNLVRANDTTPLVVINQVSPIYVSFGIPEAQLPELKRYMAQGTLQVEARPPERHRRRRRSAASRSSTTRSIRRPARSRSRARSRTRIAGSGRASSSTSTSRSTTDPNAIVVPTAAVQTGPAGHVRLRRQAGSDRRAAAGHRRAHAAATRRSSRAGSTPGETVVTDGQLRLVPGSRVSVKNADAGRRRRHEPRRHCSSSGRSRRR